MRSYELVFIVYPQAEGEGLNAVIETVKGLVERSGGKVIAVEPWGSRRLAYPIRRQWEGQYVLMRLELEAQAVTELERGLRLVEQVMRHLLVRVEDEEIAEPSEPVAA